MFFGKILRNLARTPCSDCNMGRGGNTGVRSSQQAEQASTRLRILRCSGPLPEQLKLLAGARISGGDCKNSTRQGAVFGLPKSLSLRVSPQTGAAIRFQNVQFLCLFAGLQLKDYGFPRRFAPRNDRDGFPDKQKNSTHRGAVFGLPKKSVIASQSTDWRGNPSHLRAGCHTRL